MGRKAIICECSSNGTFLIDDCVDLGLEPVVIYPPIPDESDSLIGEIRKSSEAAIAGRAEIMRVTDMREVAARLDGCDVAPTSWRVCWVFPGTTPPPPGTAPRSCTCTGPWRGPACAT